MCFLNTFCFQTVPHLQSQCTASDKTNKKQLRIKANIDQALGAALLGTYKGYGLLIVLANSYLLWYTSLQVFDIKKAKHPRPLKKSSNQSFIPRSINDIHLHCNKNMCVGERKRGREGTSCQHPKGDSTWPAHDLICFIQ